MTPYLILCLLIIIPLIKANLHEQEIPDKSDAQNSREADSIATKSKPKLRVHLLKEGFHKSLDYHFQAHEEGCYFLVKQQLPAATYVDPDELYELIIRGGYNITYPEFIDVEKPAEKASAITFLIHFHEDEGFISIPIHFRYHSPAEQQFAEVEIPEAGLYRKCPSEIAPIISECFHEAKQMQNRCGWEYLSDIILEHDIKPVTVPRGDSSLSSFVSFVTILVSWVGCAVIIYRVSKKTEELTKKIK